MSASPHERIDHGRWLHEFVVGETYEHPWRVTIDRAAIVLAQASFLDATPLYASDPIAVALGHRERPVPPMVLLNYALSFSVHDVSERAIAHLGYDDLWFPEPCYASATVHAKSQVLSVRPSRDGARGVVRVFTTLRTEEGRVVAQFERSVLIPTKPGTQMTASEGTALERGTIESRLPPTMPDARSLTVTELVPGRTLCHSAGRTVGASEHMQLTTLFRNTHPLHTDEVFASHGIAGTRVVYGGLVFAWVIALASRDVSMGLIRDVGYDRGAHPSPVVAGDTIYAATRVIDRREVTPHVALVTVRHVGTKNVRPEALLDRGIDLFRVESDVPTGDRCVEKVFEVDRRLLVRG